MNPIAALADLMVLFAGVLFVLLPEMSRPGILFGVGVAPDFRQTKEGVALIASYRRMIALVFFATLAMAHLIPHRDFLVPMRIGIAGLTGIACWIHASRKTRAFASATPSVRTASLDPQPRQVPGGWLFVAGPYLILGLAAWLMAANWNSLPESFPIHWGADGAANGWAHRTFFGVFGGLIIAAGTNAFTTVLAFVILFRTRNVSVEGGNAADDFAVKRATFVLIFIVSYFVSTVLAVLTTRPAWSTDPASSPTQFLPVVLLAVVVLIAGTLFYVVRLSRARGGAGDGTPDACWKWGVFYYNPDDPSLMVEKRAGIGWTFNFANKWAWLVPVMILLPGLITIIAVRFVK